jgi:hypothetical protein
VVQAAVGDGALARPGVEHGADREAQLLLGILRERLVRVLLVALLELLGQRLQVVRVELRVVRDPALLLGLLDRLLEGLAGHPAGDVAEHLHEAPVGVPREAVVLRLLGEPLDRLVVEAEVEHGVEHPGHRLARARAHGDQQRVVRVAEPLARLLLEPGERLGHLIGHALWLLLVALHVGDAGLRGDREPRGHPLGAEHPRHLGDVRALAAEQVPHVAGPVGEVVDPPRLARGVCHPRADPMGSKAAVAAPCRG